MPVADVTMVEELLGGDLLNADPSSLDQALKTII